MKNRIKLFWALMCTVFFLAGCGRGEMEEGLTFFNRSDLPVGAVGLRWEGETTVGCHADGSPLEREDRISFDIEGYPVTVTVYRDTEAREELVSYTVGESPGSGWYLMLTGTESGKPKLSLTGG